MNTLSQLPTTSGRPASERGLRAARAGGLAALALALAAVPLPGQPFELSDSGPASPDFAARFFARYGVNSAIEPEPTERDRELYRQVEPYLRDDPQRAIETVEAEAGEEPGPLVHYLLGSLHYQSDRLSRAEERLRRAIDAFPDFRRAHRSLGLVLVQQGRFEEAVGAWLKVVTLGGGDAQSYGLLGYAYLSRGQYQSALSAYEMARLFKPDSADFRRGQAMALLRTGQLERAAALFEELLAERPEEADYWKLQANAFLELGRREAAIVNLELVRELGGGSPETDRLLGNLLLEQGSHRLALSRYQRALEDGLRAQDFEEALRPLSYLLDRGLSEEAARYLGSLEAALPASLKERRRDALDLARARVELAAGNAESALAPLERVAERDPLNLEAFLALGEARRELGDYERAALALERALSVAEGRRREVLVSLGRLEVARGDYEAALRRLREARDLAPSARLSRYIEALEKSL